MKKILIVLTMLTACGPSKEQMEKRQRIESNVDTKIEQPLTPIGISVIKIDGCEYIYCEVGSPAIVHKANCKNH